MSGLDAAPALDGDPHEVADPVLVEHLERVPLQDPVLEVVGEELALGVVAREARASVCVRSFVPNEKKSAMLGDLVGSDARPRELDHRAAQVFDRRLLGGDRAR